MLMALNNVFRKAYWTLAACGLAYAIFLGALTHPTVQRNAMYAHNINPTHFQDLSNVEQFGFLRHQVQPFTVTTPDNVTLFAWHILPLHLYHEHEQRLKEQIDFGVQPYHRAAQSVGIQLLLNDPEATAVVSFHGNAAHLASSHRPVTYQQLLAVSTPNKPVHVIAFDYRGFGLSTGSPTEEGVIQDSVSLLSALTGQSESLGSCSTGPTKGIQPSQIILIGQSLGTFVSTALYHEWVLNLGRAPFKALVLYASFTSLPTLLDSYSIKGLTPPLLSPLLAYPRLQTWLLSQIVDKWETSKKLVELVENTSVRLELVMMHARDDWEIPWREGRASWDRVLHAASKGEIVFDRNLDLEEWRSADGQKHLRWERVRHGGHNRVVSSEHAKLALLRLIE
ncbi:hypothetical protein A1O3_08926 [Capronia epimyces CBS 606.96]|uniref:AB hydrolase-1 domain-containing protein n=1 Tax=Capronia epimyces CBS 606.96 TaxID=1182542 RepID=W9YAN3_9EURO|nr:uncharacterized protein A1O3_08926 [Capronia epimyces CBS 606.96]EXJ79424.1 hypothetical protein A1O3_08926 [Capronia epimyces CBS 606.96]